MVLAEADCPQRHYCFSEIVKIGVVDHMQVYLPISLLTGQKIWPR